MTIEQYLQMTGQGQEAFVEELRTRGSVNLRTRILLDAVAEAEELEVTRDEMTSAVEELAQMAKGGMVMDVINAEQARIAEEAGVGFNYTINI